MNNDQCPNDQLRSALSWALVIRHWSLIPLAAPHSRPFPHARSTSRLFLLLPLPRDVEFRLPAPVLHGAFAFELVPVDLELVLDGELVLPEHALGGEGQLAVLQFHVLEFRF